MGAVTGAAIELDGVTVAYDGGDILQGVSGRLPAGMLSAVVGPNGSGKTTLLKTVAGLLRPRAGTVRVTGIDRPDRIYLPQATSFDRTFPISVREVVGMGLMARIGACRSPSFSPQGDHLAFICTLSGSPQVWTVPVEGGWPTAPPAGARWPFA